MHPTMPMPDLEPLLGRTLVVVAHADDEVVGCGALLQRMREALVIFCTDGAPRDEWFWRRYGSRDQYAELRRDEARNAMSEINAPAPLFVTDETGHTFVDQELFRFLPQAFEALAAVVRERQPQALLTLAYEGGHPDHDAACFLSSQLAKEFGLPVWEFPLYHRSADGEGVRQTFPFENGNDVVLRPSADEVEGKRRMLAAYASQGDIVSVFDIQMERFRPLGAYDFSRPPLPGVLNYEAWQWHVTGGEVAEAFTNFMERGASKSGEMSLHER